MSDFYCNVPPEDDRAFGGTLRLYGAQVYQAIKSTHVVVVGIGGVGSWIVEGLVRSGIRKLTLIDMDHIAESNLNRQIHAVMDTLGASKVEAMKQRVHSINPACQVELIDDFISPDNHLQLLPMNADILVDACDQLSAKTAMALWSLQHDKPLITVGAAGGKRCAHGVEIADLYAATHDPLLAKLRYQLRKSNPKIRDQKKSGILVIFSREPIHSEKSLDFKLQSSGSLNCSGYGSTVAVTAAFGFAAVGLVLDLISLKNL